MGGCKDSSDRRLPLVTIAIPTYNRADHYLRQSLESARTQTYQNLEIIISDNYSVDDTEEFIASMADPRIRYFKQPTNIGSNNNINFCLSKANGEYFLLLCDDDLIDNDFVESCVNELQYNYEVGIIITGIRLINENGRVLREIPNMTSGCPIDIFFREWLAGRVPLYLCSTLFNTERLREIGGFRSKYNLYDDVIAQIQLAAKYGKMDVQDIKASPRLHKSKMGFTSKISEWCEDSLMVLDVMCELVQGNRETIRSEGMQSFSKRNYARARRVKSPLKRLLAYLIVFKKYDYHFPPPLYSLGLQKITIKMKRLLSTKLR